MAKKGLWARLKDKLWLICVLETYTLHTQCFIMKFIHTLSWTANLASVLWVCHYRQPNRGLWEARPWPLQEKAQFPWVLEHSLLVTNAREPLIFGLLFRWFNLRALKVFLLFCWGFSFSQKLSNFWKLWSVQILYPRSSWVRLSQGKLSG